MPSLIKSTVTNKIFKLSSAWGGGERGESLKFTLEWCLALLGRTKSTALNTVFTSLKKLGPRTTVTLYLPLTTEGEPLSLYTNPKMPNLWGICRVLAGKFCWGKFGQVYGRILYKITMRKIFLNAVIRDVYNSIHVLIR